MTAGATQEEAEASALMNLVSILLAKACMETAVDMGVEIHQLPLVMAGTVANVLMRAARDGCEAEVLADSIPLFAKVLQDAAEAAQGMHSPEARAMEEAEGQTRQ